MNLRAYCCIFITLLACCALTAMSEELTDEAVAREKAEIHMRETGENRVGYEEVTILRQASVVANSRIALLSEADPLVSNVRGYQREDGKVEITYDLNSEYQCNVTCEIYVNDSKLNKTLTFEERSHVGTVSGAKDRKIVWDAPKDWPEMYSSRVKARITVKETDIPQTWAYITISWTEWGGRDLDICGYWLDMTSVKVGWGHGSGDKTSNYRSMWLGDNVGSGPEYVYVGVAPDQILDGVSSRKYRIHFNYYGSAGSSSKARVTVSSNGITKTKVSDASNQHYRKAETSDPYLTITFDAYGNPLSID